MSTKPAQDEAVDPIEAPSEARPRVVYTQAPVLLGKLTGRGASGWRVVIGGVERELACDPDVDPALLDETLARSGRVLVETQPSGEGSIVGVVATRRAVTISPENEVAVEVDTFRVTAHRELLFSSAHAFLRIQRKNIELYGGEVVTRAREVAKILGRLISLN